MKTATEYRVHLRNKSFETPTVLLARFYNKYALDCFLEYAEKTMTSFKLTVEEVPVTELRDRSGNIVYH